MHMYKKNIIQIILVKEGKGISRGGGPKFLKKKTCIQRILASLCVSKRHAFRISSQDVGSTVNFHVKHLFLTNIYLQILRYLA